ncbi:TRAP transporter large permease [Pseudooceanicola sediminis]|uniref:TRAP transporter large permease protein n=1 Tax=Pseudooceanicola sediminis TaxID=2211117 RepID=A0A399J5L1_9RHOB|nr:TRAP transporter large permease [Pseudooceanicola sediminis]KAA2316770.1 TRAP transporter large permease [Puniceibacterium sp. HSS470]RII40773.1 TRAP transporter large permease [Pseudooceanicola sediminis]|tara:strand:- start:261311 stop:262624 length:1314 start_codon:yes stop_codon:yes gene_type:complete
MSTFEIGTYAIAAMVVLIYLGLPIAIGMLLVSFCGVALIRNEAIAMRMIGAVANDSLREYLFAVVPLFVLMGLLVTVSGVGKDTFDVFEKLLKRVTAGLGVATVFANAVFASITGISVASATVFSRVAVPEMTRHGYQKKFATGVVAGSSVLGMMIPPSLLMIVYAVLAEESVGRMFLAGIGPGILLSVLFSATILLLAKTRKDFVFTQEAVSVHQEDLSPASVARKSVPILSLMLLVLGGLYGGFFNPTEAGAAGAFGALVIALVRRSLGRSTLWTLLVETGQITVSVLLLIMAATFFSRMLALSGVPRELADFFLSGPVGPYGFLLCYLLLIVALGCLIDSISIMLIMLPIALPVAEAAGFDLVWFGVLTVVSVEVGLLTPPFGLSVYTIKSAMNDPDLQVGDIFRGAFPFVIAMIVAVLLIIVFPPVATWLAYL